MKSLYNRYLLPHLIHKACSYSPATQQRKILVPQATGNVLEIGIGSGLNLPFYQPEQVSSVTGVDPSKETWELCEFPISQSAFPISYHQASAAALPFSNSQFDTVLMTYTLCSIPHVPAALQEIRRVLKPTGRFLFCEHGLAPELWVKRWQHMITPVWKQFGGGCHLNRDIPALLTEHGFHLAHLQTSYLPGWRPASFNYLGEGRIG